MVTQRVRAHHHPGRRRRTRTARGDGAGFGDREVHREARPGLHHITLRVEDIRAALAHLKARGVRLVDDGAAARRGGRARRLHPSVGGARRARRVEAGRGARAWCSTVKRLAFGDLQLTMLHDGGFRLDGGAMFGVVPRPLWEKLAPADDRHRIQLAMRPLLVEAEWGRMIVDCGAGDKMAPKQADIYALDSRASSRPCARRGRAHGRVDRLRAGDAPAFRSLRRRDGSRRTAARPAVSQRAGTSSGPPSGRTPRIRTSATAPAICRTTSSR